MRRDEVYCAARAGRAGRAGWRSRAVRAPRSRRFRRGIMFVELMFVLLLAAAFAIVAARLFRSTTLLTYHAGAAQNGAASFEAAVAALRADVWAAKSVTAADQRTLTVMPPLAGGGGAATAVTWNISETNLVRGDGRRAQSWPIPPGCSFAADDAGTVTLTVPQSASAHASEVRLTQQVRLVTRLTGR